MIQLLTKDSALSHADLSADRNRNVSDRHAVEILCCCRFNIHVERNGDQLINRDRAIATDLSAVLPQYTWNQKIKRTLPHLFSDPIPFLSHGHGPGLFVCMLKTIPQVLIWIAAGTVFFGECKTEYLFSGWEWFQGCSYLPAGLIGH